MILTEVRMAETIEQRGSEWVLVGIEGEQLSAVTFVQDYLQLHFDGPILTAITLPSVVENGATLEAGSPGYRDGVCGLIGRNVIRAYVRPGDHVRVDFDNGSALVIWVQLDTDPVRTGEK